MVSTLIKSLKEILYPRHCLLCREKISLDEQNDLVCLKCLKEISPHLPPFCRKCGRGLAWPDGRGLASNKPEGDGGQPNSRSHSQSHQENTANHICGECPNTRFYFERAWAACHYQKNARKLIHQFKYKNKIYLSRLLSELMIDFIQQYHLPLNHCDYLIPIPLSPAKLREREFNQAEVLAKEIAGHLGIKLLNDNLKRVRNTPAQADLDKESRWSNIAGAFGITNPDTIKEKTILLIDDVLTTGATASEASRVLKNAGASVVYVLTLAS